jgi:hypothetical protein
MGETDMENASDVDNGNPLMEHRIRRNSLSTPKTRYFNESKNFIKNYLNELAKEERLLTEIEDFEVKNNDL